MAAAKDVPAFMAATSTPALRQGRACQAPPPSRRHLTEGHDAAKVTARACRGRIGRTTRRRIDDPARGANTFIVICAHTHIRLRRTQGQGRPVNQAQSNVIVERFAPNAGQAIA
jgi:hypothetical protein